MSSKKVAGASSSKAQMREQPEKREQDAPTTLVPKLRFPEFRETKGWETTPLGELGAIVTGKTPSTKEDDLWDGEILFITPTDITEDEKYQHSTQRTVVETKGTKVLPAGSVVYTCIASIGKMALTVLPSVTNQQINAVVPNGKTAREFIYYSLANLTPWIKSIPATSTLPIINKTEFSKFIISHPGDKREQQKIAECLSSVDELIAAQARKVDALKTHKKGLMQQLFPTVAGASSSKGIGEQDAPTTPRLRFPEFQNAGEWKQIELGEKVDLLSGYPFDGPDISQDSNGIRLLRGINITEGRIRHNPEIDRYYTGSTDELEKFRVHTNDLVIGMDGSKVGKNSALVSESDSGALLIQRVARLRTKNPALIQFIFQRIHSSAFHSYVDRINTSSGIPHISAKQIKEFQICFPSDAEQQRIADCLTSLDDLIAAQTKKHAALKTHKQGLMQQLFPTVAGASSSNAQQEEQDAPATITEL